VNMNKTGSSHHVIGMFNVFAYCEGGYLSRSGIICQGSTFLCILNFKKIFRKFLFFMAVIKFGGRTIEFMGPKLVR
jgi:hypothetical protein